MCILISEEVQLHIQKMYFGEMGLLPTDDFEPSVLSILSWFEDRPCGLLSRVVSLPRIPPSIPK
jgi:hypothetical protein